MSLVGRISLDPQPGQRPLAAVPEMELRLEDIRPGEDDRWRVIYWASGDDFGAYETAMAEDPEIDASVHLADVGDERLYRVTFAEAVSDRMLHSVAVAEDITVLDARMTAEDFDFTARFPTRDALVALQEACRERDVAFRLEHLYEERAAGGDGGTQGQYGTTEAQREALLTAFEMGYFDVPRAAELADVAAELDVSASAVSSRLRRAQQALVRNTLAADQGR